MMLILRILNHFKVFQGKFSNVFFDVSLKNVFRFIKLYFLNGYYYFSYLFLNPFEKRSEHAKHFLQK